MLATDIIDKIKQLPPEEQAEVIRFAYRLDAERKLTGEELSTLAQKYVETENASEAMMVRESIIRGFYGSDTDA